MIATTQLPSGTITFLFTDIQGSTALWERDREAMQAALELHDALLRQAIEARNGHVFKTVGDAFCAAFAQPDAGLGRLATALVALNLLLLLPQQDGWNPWMAVPREVAAPGASAIPPAKMIDLAS